MRNLKVDYYKGITIFLVVYAHIISYLIYDMKDNLYSFNKVITLIYSFHMPLFALLSGYCLTYSVNKKSTVSTLLVCRIIKLAVPALIWAGVGYFEDILRSVKSFSVRFLPVALITGGAWFIWVIIILDVATTLIFRCFNKNYHLKLLALGMLLLLLNEFIPHIEPIAVLYFPYILGFIIHEKMLRFPDVLIGSLAVGYIILLLSVGIDFYRSYGSFRILSSQYGVINQIFINIYTYFLMFGGICLFVIFSDFFENTICTKKKKMICNWGGQVCKFICSTVLYYRCFHFYSHI